MSSGPLSGVRVVELAGIGPGPFAVMLLADMGATVVRVDRTGGPNPDYTPNPVIERGRQSIAVDLKTGAGLAVLLDLVAASDVLVESYRPGVAERLGFGPDVCHARNPALVYGRLSAWGQSGPLAQVAGHDINYIAMSGALHSIGRAGEPPVPPLNLIGDFGGGAASLAFGIVCALWEASGSGRGQVVDANVLESTAGLMGLVHGLRAQGRWSGERASNLLDGGCPYYDVYTCADGRWISFGAIEERFYRNALEVLGGGDDAELVDAHKDRARWPALRAFLTRAFGSRTRDEWVRAFEGVDACVAPVLDLDEARLHPQSVARTSYVPIPDSEYHQPSVAPRFSRSRTPVPPRGSRPGADTRSVLTGLGYPRSRIDQLLAGGAVAER
ncbi:CaiB/BaiF CoA-transferase family protein [Dactylosporangium sp. NPDC049742]|uniref:CaiB/BaiF CoA transferase family protein n=1 Tax=Dactylosporangium sp. NPDC049742 TaxID=3154737 RepID=UPI003441D46B